MCDRLLYSTIVLLCLFQHAAVYPLTPQDLKGTSGQQTETRPGRYVPELHGADRGRYIPDESGKYRHIKVPYNGGYGDRGLEYVHDSRGLPPPRFYLAGDGGLALGANDHLRFSIDFNTDGSGWEIVQFEWVRDGDESKKYKYEHKEQLWSTDAADSYREKEMASTAEQATEAYEYETEGYSYDNTNVHVDGEYENKIYNVSYSNDNTQNAPSQSNIKSAISEVLDYIQNNVLPTLS